LVGLQRRSFRFALNLDSARAMEAKASSSRSWEESCRTLLLVCGDVPVGKPGLNAGDLPSGDGLKHDGPCVVVEIANEGVVAWSSDVGGVKIVNVGDVSVTAAQSDASTFSFHGAFDIVKRTVLEKLLQRQGVIRNGQ